MKNKGGVLSPKLSTSLKKKIRHKQNSVFGFNSPRKQQTVKDMVLRLENRISQSSNIPECPLSSENIDVKNVTSNKKVDSQNGTDSDFCPKYENCSIQRLDGLSSLNTVDGKFSENRSNGASKCGLIYDEKCPNSARGVKGRVQSLITGYSSQVVAKPNQSSPTTKHSEGMSLGRLPSNGNVGKLTVKSPKMGISKKKSIGSSKKLKSGVRNCQKNQITNYLTPLDEPTEKVGNMVGKRTKGFETGQTS